MYRDQHPASCAVPGSSATSWATVRMLGDPRWDDAPTAEMIMGWHTPQALPVLSALARGYAVCDHWFCSVPTMTMPNRAFACAATSQGHLDDHTKIFTVPSIFGLMTAHGLDWKISADRLPVSTRYQHFPTDRTYEVNLDDLYRNSDPWCLGVPA